MASEKHSKKGKGKGKGVKDEGELSLDEISNLRQNAQQKSIDAVKGLEDRYQKVKEKMGPGVETAEKTGDDVKGATTTVQKLSGYVVDKTVAAKDTVAGYTENVAADAKDKAAVVGLGVAEYTAEKTLQATKATVDVVGGVAAYVGEKVVAAKDAVVGAEENAAAYTARMKAEAERKLEEDKKKASGDDDRNWKGDVLVGEGSQAAAGDGGSDVVWDEEEMWEGENGGGGGGLLQAIGETLVEIAQTAKNLIIGSGEYGQGNDNNSYQKK